MSQYEVGVCLTFMQDGATALMYASDRGEAGTVRVLLDHGAIGDLRDNVRIIDMISFCNHMHNAIVLLCTKLVSVSCSCRMVGLL